MEKKDFGARLLSLRKEKGVSQADVAEYIGLTVAAYQNYENGRREAGYDTISKLADFYGVTTDYLLGRPSAPEPKTPEQLLVKLSELNNFDELEEALFEQYMQLPETARKKMIQFMHNAANMAAAKKRSKVEQSQKECARTAPDQNAPNTPDTELMQESPVLDDEP